MNPRPTGSPVDPAALTGVLRFGVCEIRIASREILFCRQYSPISPKAFDVLIYLIERRDRVVTKNELLDAIWRTTHVSESVVARMVMKIRRVIGDTGEVHQLIRTVHRIGYRFIGTLDVGVAQPSARAWNSELSVGPRPRLAILPFRNATGVAELSWLELGMVTLLANALATRAELETIALRDSMLALGALPIDLPMAATGVAVQRATAADFGLAAIVSGTVGRFRIEWSLYRAGGECMSASVTGAHLPALASELGQRVSAWILGDARAPVEARTR